jgi:hypothetical protein
MIPLLCREYLLQQIVLLIGVAGTVVAAVGIVGLVLVVGNNLVGRMGVGIRMGIGLVGMEGGSRGNRFGFECCSLLE